MSTHKVPTVAFKFSKAGSIDANPMTLVAKAGSAASNISAGSTFVTVREEGGLGHYFVTADNSQAMSVAFALAQAVSARSDTVDVPDLSAVDVIVSLNFDRGSSSALSTQANTDLSTAVDSIATSLRVGEWIAVAVRKPGKRELRWYQTWKNHRSSTGQHHSLHVQALVMSMWAGGRDAASARNVLRRVSASLPGFDVRTRQEAVRPVDGAVPYFLGTVIGVGLGISSNYLPSFAPELAEYAGVGVLGYILGALALVAGVLTITRHLPSRAKRARLLMSGGRVPAAKAHLIAPKPPKNATTTKDDIEIPASDGEYPLTSTGFMVGAHLPLSIIARDC